MSKFLLNLLLQISKALVYSKINFLFGKEFSFTFGPIGPAASRPCHGPLVFFSTGRTPSPHWSSASRPAQLALSAQPTARLWRPARLLPPIRKSVNFRNCLLHLLPPTIATHPRSLPTSCRRARGASFSRDPFVPPLHRSSYPPSTRALMALIIIHRRRHYSGHSTAPPHSPSPSPSPYKRAPPPRSIPQHSCPPTGSPPLLPAIFHQR
jgi:hypothetical protein